MKTYTLQELTHPREHTYFWIIAAFSALVWLILAVGTLGLGFIYLVLAAFVTFCIKSVYVSTIKGFGIRVSETQYSDIHSEVVRISEAIGLKQAPETYVFYQSGIFNAFALNIFSRKFIVLTTRMLEACGDDPKLLSFIIGHEIGHHVRKHTSRAGFLAPGRIIPWLGKGYSRACEYTCDAIGAQFGAGNLEQAGRGIAILATVNYGRGTSMNLASYMEQARDVRQFWPAVVYSNSSHPFTAMRLARLHMLFDSQSLPHIPKANKAGLILSPLFSLGFIFVLFYAFFLATLLSGAIDGMKNQGLFGGGAVVRMTEASEAPVVKHDPSSVLSRDDGVTFGEDKEGGINSIATKFGKYRWSPSSLTKVKGYLFLPSLMTPFMEEPRGIVLEASDGDYGTVGGKPCKMATTLYFLNLQNLSTKEIASFESTGRRAGEVCSALTLVGRQGSQVILHAQEFDPGECGIPIWSGDPKRLFSFDLSDPRSGLKPYIPSPEIVIKEQEEREACYKDWEEDTGEKVTDGEE